MKQNNSALYSALSFLLIAVLMLSVVGVIMRYTNGGTTDFALFYVAHDGQNIMTDTTVSLNDGETTTFAPRYSADDIMSAVGQETKTKGYNVKIVPNITKETSFTYRVGDNKYRFEKLADTDFSSAFNLKKEEKSFSVKVDEFTVKELLSVQHENKPVILPENFDYKQSYFNLIISSYDEKSSVVLGLKPVPLVFTIDGQKFQAERGMTYGEWKKSCFCEYKLPDGERLEINGATYNLYDQQIDGEIVEDETSLTENGAYFAENACFKFIIDGSEYLAKWETTYGEWQKSNYCSFNLSNGGRLQINGLAYDLYNKQKDGTALTNDTKLEKGGEYFAAHALMPFWLDNAKYYTRYYTTLKQWAISENCPIRIIGNEYQFNGNLYPICYSEQNSIYKASCKELKEENFIESKEYYAISILYETRIVSNVDGVFGSGEYDFFVPLYQTWKDYISNLKSSFRIETDGRICYDYLFSVDSETGIMRYQRYFLTNENGSFVRSTDSVISSSEIMPQYGLVSGYEVGYDSDGNRKY